MDYNNSTNITVLQNITAVIMNSTLQNDVIVQSKKYCGKGLDNFHTEFSRYYNWLALIICVFGGIANMLNIAVLTRKEMRSPTNAILTGLAIADLLVMIDYVPFALYNGILSLSRVQKFTYSWVWYVLFHATFGQVCHTISIFLTVLLAVWRYIAISFPQKNQELCNMRITIKAIITSYILCAIISIPSYLSIGMIPATEFVDQFGHKVNSSVNITDQFMQQNRVNQQTLYYVNLSQLSRDYPSLIQINFWIYSVIIKFIPCVALSWTSWKLISSLLEAKKRRKVLMGNNQKKKLENGKVVDSKESKISDKEKQTDRTTRMLLAVLLLFLITELPQAILGLLSAASEEFYMNCYQKLGDLMDILALLNSGINFILYCSMSQQFRNTFQVLFRPKFLDRWKPKTNANLNKDTVPVNPNDTNV